jgi:3,4-dihydroxy 2-butanone 4-phosphate synthase/GTP cyclohydrolase II
MLNRIKEYAQRLQQNRDELPPIRPDDKDYGIGAQIIHDLGIRRVEYLTCHKHSTDKTAIKGFDIRIEKTTPLCKEGDEI